MYFVHFRVTIPSPQTTKPMHMAKSPRQVQGGAERVQGCALDGKAGLAGVPWYRKVKKGNPFDTSSPTKGPMYPEETLSWLVICLHGGGRPRFLWRVGSESEQPNP